MRKERIYICHTYYHVYVTFLKEFALGEDKRGGATLILSRMSNNFEQLRERVLKEAGGVFGEVLEYDEKREEYFPKIAVLRQKSDSFIKAILNRIRFTKQFGKAQEAFLPVDFQEYKDIYVYCDSDPIGYYLNYKHLYYHALEDGLNSIAHFNMARYDNRGHFKIKVFLSAINLIFIQNGYGKYCVDMEVNDISAIKYPCKKYKEVPRKALEKRLSDKEKELLLKVFVRDFDRLKEQMLSIKESSDKSILILTEPLCSLDVRKRIFRDLADEYGKEGTVFFKRHPRDELDYDIEFPEILTIDGTVPMEMLNFISDLRFDKVVSVFTEIAAIEFAEQKERLGADFMDRYELPEIHRQNEKI